jgi:pimeloyl-ACP methyl ester carboxylesterase
MGTPPSQGRLPINGLDLFYEVYGQLGAAGTPLLLIPGAFMATTSMRVWAEAFATRRAVIVFDQQGHGRTPDTSRGMSYEQFAVAYLQKMKRLNADDQNISDEQMRSISAKTMVIIGDADGVKPEHALAMFRLRGGGDEEAAATGVLQRAPAARLVVLPAMSHVGISGESKVLVPMVNAFLDDVPPTTPELF